MQPGVEPEYLLKLDTHKHTIIMLCLFRASRCGHSSNSYLVRHIIEDANSDFTHVLGVLSYFCSSLLKFVNGHTIGLL